jgi:hypothetical protein
MRNFIGRCQKVIEKVNKSKNLKLTLDKKMVTDFGRTYETVQTTAGPQQRMCLSTYYDAGVK